MSPIKKKRFFNEKKIDKEVNKLTRRPLYPNIDEEKENMEFVSSDDSPEKFPYGHLPVMPRKSNSSTSTDSMQDTPGSPKRRSERLQQNQMNNFQDSEDSDDTNYPRNQDQEKSEISSDFKFKEHLSPEADRLECLKDGARRGKLNQPEIQPRGTDPSAIRLEYLKTRRRKLNQPKLQPQCLEPSDSTSDFIQSSPKSYVYLMLFCVILLICLLVAFVYWPKYPDTPGLNGQLNASTLVDSLKLEFENQPRLTFRIIFSALKNVLEVEPKAPAIILLLASNGSETLCSRLANSLVDSLYVPDYTVKISGKDYSQANSNHAKMKIDETISNALKSDQLGSILIEGLDQIPGQAAMILHKYSDHENAPFKKAIFVMTVNYSKAISDYSDTKVWDKAANDHLLSVWTDIGVDQATPLLARLTVSVAVIKDWSL